MLIIWGGGDRPMTKGVKRAKANAFPTTYRAH